MRRVLVLWLILGCESDATPPVTAPAVKPDGLTPIAVLGKLADYRDPKSPYDCTIIPTMQRHFAGMRIEACGLLDREVTPKQTSTTRTCVTNALQAQRPMVFAQEIQGTDSGVVTANLVRMEQRRYVGYEAHFDSDPCGGGCSDRGWTRIVRCTEPPHLQECFEPRGGVCLACGGGALVETCRMGKPSAVPLVTAEQARTQLLGATPASLGPAFGPLVLGAPAATWQTADVKAAIEDIERGGIVSIDTDRTQGASVDGFDITFSGPCTAIRRLVVARWGESTDETWLDPVNRRRASFDLAKCTLRVERYAELADWIADTATAPFPLAAIGIASQAFAKRVGAEVDSDRIRWTVPGIGRGTGTVVITAATKNGRIITLDSEGFTDDATLVALRARLTALQGNPLEDNVWAARAGYRISLDAGTTSGLPPDKFTLHVGLWTAD
ncbi:MAG: hypothetical protein ABI867_30395 [Kofleriaceae bacterium]